MSFFDGFNIMAFYCTVLKKLRLRHCGQITDFTCTHAIKFAELTDLDLNGNENVGVMFIVYNYS